MLSAQSEQQQFRAIYEECHDVLRRFLFSLTRNHEDTADLIQETFLRLYEQDSYPVSYKSWLYRTGYRLFIDLWRKNHKIQCSSVEESTQPCPQATPELSYLHHETKVWIETHLNELTTKQRMIFMLKYNEGASYQQIGNYIGCPENTVKCLVRRARIHLCKLAHRDDIRISG